MTESTSGWFTDLPATRLIAEYSMWSADLVNLAGELKRIAAFADVLHIDVADGHFAPALLFFPDLVAAIKKTSAVPIHVHLMVADDVLLPQAQQFAEAGADLISVHAENGAAVAPALDYLESRGIRKGLVLKVETPVRRAWAAAGSAHTSTSAQPARGRNKRWRNAVVAEAGMTLIGRAGTGNDRCLGGGGRGNGAGPEFLILPRHSGEVNL